MTANSGLECGSVAGRARAALRALYVGDALAMPVHWYYNPGDILREFPGGIQKLEDAPSFHPSSIMSLHSTTQGGRSNLDPGGSREIVGDVILKGKRKFWDKANLHYHHGMKAGQNTLNAHCARLVTRVLTGNMGHYERDQFLDAYIEFMTAEVPRHPDTYAESYHRGYFANLEAGEPRDRCGAVTHDTASVGGLVTLAPIVISELKRGATVSQVQEVCREHVNLVYIICIVKTYFTIRFFQPPDQPVILLIGTDRG